MAEKTKILWQRRLRARKEIAKDEGERRREEKKKWELGMEDKVAGKSDTQIGNMNCSCYGKWKTDERKN